MEPDTLVAYLVTLAVPVWLLLEAVIVSQRSSKKQAAKGLELGKLAGRPAPRVPAATPRPRAMQVADGRKTA